MSNMTTLSTVIDSRVKDAVSRFCKQRGLKLRYLIEQALVEQLEDEIDAEAYHARRFEGTISLDKILASRKKK